MPHASGLPGDIRYSVVVMRILHCADIHLGRRRLDGRLPEADFAAALSKIVARALEWKAHVFLIAGDLFDTPQIPPPVLRQAAAALAPLKKARIPVLAIEGNHDRFSSGSVLPTWVRYLAEDGLLTLLSTPFGAEGPRLTPYDLQTGQGSWVEIGGIRFVGAGYLGAGTVRKVQALVAALPASHGSTVMLLHAGPEYFVGETGGFDPPTLAAMREKVAYLALGHIHRPMLHGEAGRPWAINPGSPENCRLDEAGLKGPRGWAEVEIEPQALPGLALLRAEIMDCPRRPVERIDLDISTFGNKLKEGSQAIQAAAVKAIVARQLAPESVVRLFLRGELNIGRIALEPQALGAAIAEQTRIAGVEVNQDEIKLYTGRPGGARTPEGLTTAEIERLALEEILRERPIEGLEERIPQAAEFCAKLRELVARGAGPEAVLELLETSELPAAMARELEKSLR